MEKRVIILIFIIFLSIGFFTTLVLTFRPSKNFSDAELREYNGTILSPASSFRENSIKGHQDVNLSEYRLKVDGLVSQPASYTYEEVINNFPHEKRVNTLQCVEGWDVTVLWEGLRLLDILNASFPKSNGNTVIFHSIDGYTTSIPLETVIDNNYLLAYKINEITLPPERGFPFSLVADGKWGYKWARWVERIEISSDPSYRGYWEQRGYAAGGDLNESFYG